MLVITRRSGQAFNIRVSKPCSFDIRVRERTQDGQDEIDVVFDIPDCVRVDRLEKLGRKFGEK